MQPIQKKGKAISQENNYFAYTTSMEKGPCQPVLRKKLEQKSGDESFARTLYFSQREEP